jgi:hypothetical protein
MFERHHCLTFLLQVTISWHQLPSPCWEIHLSWRYISVVASSVAQPVCFTITRAPSALRVPVVCVPSDHERNASITNMVCSRGNLRNHVVFCLCQPYCQVLDYGYCAMPVMGVGWGHICLRYVPVCRRRGTCSSLHSLLNLADCCMCFRRRQRIQQGMWEDWCLVLHIISGVHARAASR